MPRSPASACLISATEMKGAEPVKWKKRLWPSKWRDQWIRAFFDISKTSPQRGCAFNQDPFEAPSSPRITAISGSTWCVKMWKYFQRIQFDMVKSRAKTQFHISGSPKPLLCRSVPAHPAWWWDWVTTNPGFCRPTPSFDAAKTRKCTKPSFSYRVPSFVMKLVLEGPILHFHDRCEKLGLGTMK